MQSSGQLLTDKRIAFLTYNKPHRKSQDLAVRLFQAGFNNVVAVAQRWVDRELMDMLYPQRPGDLGWPAQPLGQTPLGFFSKFGWEFVETEREDVSTTLANVAPDLVVIAGAGILGPDVTENFTVVNSHPGYLPFTRGLDTIKWGLFHDMPIGVTTHIVDDRADAGRLIHQVRCPLKPNDDFSKFATRLYELEMEMMVPAMMAVLAAGSKESFPKIDVEGFPSYRRMGKTNEREMIKKFEEIRAGGKQPGDKLMMFALPPLPWGSLT